MTYKAKNKPKTIAARRRILAVVGVTVLFSLVVLAITNPTQVEFSSYLGKQMQASAASTDPTVADAMNVLGLLGGDGAQVETSYFAGDAVTHTNGLIFSIYHVNLNGQPATYLGILRSFRRLK